jgi:Zn-dependent protease with chaperone function
MDREGAIQAGHDELAHVGRRYAPDREPECDLPRATIVGVHEDLIRSARRRCWIAAAVGLLVLTCTIAAVVFPVAWILGAASNPVGTDLGFGWDLVVWAATVGLAIGAVGAIVVFAWSLLHAEREALQFIRAWPGPDAAANPPPALADDILPTVERILEPLVLAAGVRAPRVAAVIDDAPNCLTVGRTPATAWIVVTTGLVEALSHRELEAVLAYELGRVAELEVSLDTVVYALTARTFEIWAAAFDDVDEVAVLLVPLGLVALPFFLASVALRGATLRNRARLADGLAVRYCRDPGALARALRRILDATDEVRRGDPANAHLWLEYPHSRGSRWLLRTHRILPRRIMRLERLAGAGSASGGDPPGPTDPTVG